MLVIYAFASQTPNAALKGLPINLTRLKSIINLNKTTVLKLEALLRQVLDLNALLVFYLILAYYLYCSEVFCGISLNNFAKLALPSIFSDELKSPSTPSKDSKPFANASTKS